MDTDERLAAARAFIAERRVLEFGYTLPTPSQEENDKMADHEMTMLKVWDLSPVDPHSFDPTEPPGRPVSPPVNSVPPAVSMVSGAVEIGNTATCTTGTWSGSPTYTRQWQRNTTNIGGATGTTYLLQGADVGATIRCVVTATNAGGQASANSNAIGPVVEPEMGEERGTGGSRRRR